jgi:hypothetical protein
MGLPARRAAARAWTREWCERRCVRGAPGCPLYVAASSLPGAGRGVFCERDLPAGAWVTPYDGAARYVGAMACVPGRVADYALEVPGHAVGVPGRAETILGVAPRGAAERRALGRGGRVVQRAAGGRARGFGHLLNDAVHPEVTRRANNCEFRFRGAAAYIVTTRAVPAGQELLVPYHVSYWATRAAWVRPRDLPPRLAGFCAAARAAARVVARDVSRGLALEEYLGGGAYAFVPREGPGPRVMVDLGWDDARGEPVVLGVRD